MRLLPALLLLPLFAFQAHAQTAPAPQSPPAPAAAAAGMLAHANAPHHRMSWQQRFAQANSTHDGHLTLAQANVGYRTLARHFTEIDAGKKGYVTVEDIAAWHKLQRAMHHSNHGESLRPRPAMQHGMPAPHEMNTSTDKGISPMAQPGAQPGTSDTSSTQPGASDASGTQPRHGT
jgi:hypothetical protein